MGAAIRIGMYVFAGWLFNAGIVDEELRTIIALDPELAELVQGLAAGIVYGAALYWRRVARRKGWGL